MNAELICIQLDEENSIPTERIKEMMDYVRNMEKENKKLSINKSKNLQVTQLKAYIEDLKTQLEERAQKNEKEKYWEKYWAARLLPSVRVLHEEHKKLKEENEKLKELSDRKDSVMEHIESYYDMDKHTRDYDKLDKYSDKLINKINKLDKMTDKLLNKIDEKSQGNKRLKEENKILYSFQKEVDSMECGLAEINEDYEDLRFYDLPNLIKELNKENERFRDDIEYHPDYENCIDRTIETAQKELKEENKKLQNEVETLKDLWNK